MFSIVIPVYNEEEIIESNVKKLIKFLHSYNDYEIIIANNGSTDKTLDKAKKLSRKYKQVKFVTISIKGAGLAFKMAAKKSKHNILISQDMDLSTDLSFIDKAVKLMRRYDIVIGSKKIGKQERSFFRKIPSNIFIFLTKLLLNLDYEDYSMAAKAYRKKHVLKHLNKIDDGTSYVIELIYFGKKDNKKIIEIPVNCSDKRKSKFNIINESIYRFKNLVKLSIYGLKM